MAESKSTFKTLNDVNVADKVKQKNGLTYFPWASACAEVKKRFPDATYKIYPQIIDELGNTRFWHDDGKTGWVEVGVTIDGNEMIEVLAIMDFKNKAIPAENITSVDANKAVKRCFVKACALHGLGLYIYEGEDLPEEASKTIELKTRVKDLVVKKCSLSDKAKKKVGDLCKAAEKQANPDLGDESITGNYNNIDDIEILKNLEKQLMAVKK